MELILYSYNGNSLTVNKTLGGGFSVNGYLRESASNESMSVEIDGSFDSFDYNYCYCVELNRYYFIDSFYLDITGLYTVNLRIDYLKSFENEILSSESEIIECENNYNNDYVDYDSQTTAKTTVFDGDNPFAEKSSIILVTSKGGAS